MKKIILALFVTVCSLQLFAADPIVDEKVLNSFNKTFKNAEQVSWSEFPDAYQVRFTQNEITSKLTYDKEGNIIRALRYYHEEQLPLMIVSRVKEKYSGKQIYGVVEESSEEGTYYHITLQDEKNWIDVKADVFGSLTLEKKFKKA